MRVDCKHSQSTRIPNHPYRIPFSPVIPVTLAAPACFQRVHSLHKRNRTFTAFWEFLLGEADGQLRLKLLKLLFAMTESAGRNVRSSSSARAVSRELNIPWCTVRKVLRTNIVKWYPYKNLKLLIDFATWRRHSLRLCSYVFCKGRNWHVALEHFVHWWSILLAHWGPNCRIWGSSPPTNVHEVALYRERITPWCGFTAHFLIGLFSLEELGPQGQRTCGINGTRYCNLLRQDVIPALRGRGALDSTVPMKNGAPPHIAHEITRLLRNTFGENRIVSRTFQNVWPPRSPYFNPSDFWLCGYLKDMIYQRNTNTHWWLKMS